MKNSYEPLGTAVAIKVTSSPEQIVAVAAAVNTTPLMFAVKLAAGGVSIRTWITLPGASQVVVPVSLMVILLKKVSVVKAVVGV